MQFIRMSPIFKCLVLASLLVAQVFGQTPTAASDPCRLDSRQQIFEVKEILNCYNSIPTDATRINSTLVSLRQLIQTYSFTDIAMANIPPYHVNVDLASALDTIAENNYVRDYDFHMDLSRLFNKLNDAHTMYYAPSPYLGCLGVKAFSLVPTTFQAKEDASIFLLTQRLGVDRDWNWPINPADYANLQVVAINGQDPRDYLMEYSDHVGTYKDRLVRFNYLFDFVGWGVIDPYTFPISDIPVEVVTLRKSPDIEFNVTVPVKMFCSSLEFANTADFIALIDTPSKKRAVEAIELTPDLRKERVRRIQGAIGPVTKPAVDSEMEHLDIFERVELALKRLQAKRSTEAQDSLQIVKSVEDGSMHLMLYLDKNNNVVPVLKVTSFGPETEEDQDAWVKLAIGFNAVLETYNWTYAIADVNKNGGGIICFTLLLQALMDERIASVDVHHENVLWTPYNMRKTPMFDKIYNGIQETDEYLDMQTGDTDPAQAYYNSVTANISLPNGINSELSKFTYFPGSCKPWIAQLLPEVKAWPKNLIVTTDGSCGSACAAFVAKMTKLGSANIVAIGGDTKYSADTFMRTASFPGGNVVSWDDMHFYSSKTTPLQTSAWARFNWHQAFSNASYETYPLEYDYAAFEPTQRLRNWGMVWADNPLTIDGRNTLLRGYGTVVQIWGDFVQTSPVEPPSSAPSSDTPRSDTPYNGPISDRPSSHGPYSNVPFFSNDSGSATVPLWAFVVVAVVAFIAVVFAIVFGFKYAQMKKLVGDEGSARLLPFID